METNIRAEQTKEVSVCAAMINFMLRNKDPVPTSTASPFSSKWFFDVWLCWNRNILLLAVMFGFAENCINEDCVQGSLFQFDNPVVHSTDIFLVGLTLTLIS